MSSDPHTPRYPLSYTTNLIGESGIETRTVDSMPKTPGALLLVGAILAVFGLVICSAEKKKSLDPCKGYLL